ncbi:MAG: hypothetical protein ABI042_11045 [Verrucomicrobiota bacterium]
MFGLSKKKREEIDELGVIIGALERFIFHIEKNDWDKDSAWDFDDHMSIKFDDKRAEAVRQLVWQVSDAFPGDDKMAHSPEGINVLKAILAALKKE